MKFSSLSTALGVLALMSFALHAPAAHADSKFRVSVGNGHHYSPVHHNSHRSHRNYHNRHHSGLTLSYGSDNYRLSLSTPSRIYNDYSNRTRGYSSHSYRSNNYTRACHKVSKTGYWRGEHARIGGTMCYDRYGNGYVVEGSRYLIGYY